MSDEFTFVIAKALLIIAVTAAVLLFLAWVAATRCFLEPPRFRVREQVPDSSQEGASHAILEQSPHQTV